MRCPTLASRWSAGRRRAPRKEATLFDIAGFFAKSPIEVLKHWRIIPNDHKQIGLGIAAASRQPRGWNEGETIAGEAVTQTAAAHR